LCAQTKSGKGAIGYRRILPEVEITLLWDIVILNCPTTISQ